MMHRAYSLAATLLLFVFAVVSPAWAELHGEVVRIIDGDTVVVLVDRQQVRVRLSDIDAPESGQAFGSRSRQTLADMAFRKPVRVEEKDVDQYGRTLGVIHVLNCTPLDPSKRPVATCNEVNANAEMVRSGMAWAYRYQDQPTDRRMHVIEQEARRQRLGLWSDPHAVEPWKWRRSSANK